MRYRRQSANEDLPQYPEYLPAVLSEYGFDDVTENLGSRPVKCAFHGDKTPSATVNTAEGWFNCHTHTDCPGGNAIQIIMQKENLAYASALERAEALSRKYGISVQRAPGRRGRMAGRSGNRSGTRALRRSWRSS